jgi:hypothetical protein
MMAIHEGEISNGGGVGDNPISDRMKQLRTMSVSTSGVAISDKEPTEHQNASVSELMNARPDRRSEYLYGNAYDVTLDIEALKKKLETETDEQERKRIDAELRGLEDKISPTAKRVAANKNRALVLAALEYFRENGAPSKIAKLIAYLRGRGFDSSSDNSPEGRGAHAMTAKKVRDILKDRFGLEGTPGRKPKDF